MEKQIINKNTQIHELELPIKVSTNKIYAGCHWTQRKKHKDIMLWAMLGSRLKRVEKAELEFNFEFKTRPIDSSNTSYLAKLIEDCLVHYKIIPDDNYKVIPKISLSSKKGDKDKAIIIIKEIKE